MNTPQSTARFFPSYFEVPSLPEQTCFHQGGSLAVEGTSQGTHPGCTGIFHPAEDTAQPVDLFIYFHLFIYSFLLFSLSLSFIFNFFLFYFSLSSRFFIFIYLFHVRHMCNAHERTQMKKETCDDPEMKMWHLATMKSLQGVT